MTQAARAATSSELILLRTAGDWSRAYLAIYKPNVIYTAVLDGVPTSNDMVGEIPFVSGVGTLADVKAEMTLWVGSTAGARDLGACRIRKAPIAGAIYIGFTSEVDWAGAATVYLTVVDHAMLSKKPVLMDAGVVLMDGEHAFVDQHIDFDPVPVMTPHAVVTLTGATVDVLFDAGDSWVFDSTITGYAWTAPGASASSGMATATPTITYNAAGYYRVECVVTAANGKTATGIRFVMVFDATDKPHVVEVRDPEADYDSGGWSFAVKMHADADPTNVIEGALAILFAEDHFGSTSQSIGQVETRENIICWGYIAGESIEWDAEISSVEFEVQGPQYWLKQIEASPIKLACASNTPANWETMPALTVDRALWHVLHWRSNATALLNITLTGDTRYAPTIETMEGALWGQMDDVAWNKILGRIGCDRTGRFFAVIDPQCVAEADRAWATVMTLTKKDWIETVSITRSTQRKLAMLSASALVSDATGNASTMYALAMGHIHARHGKSEVIDKLLAGSQAQLLDMAGLYMGWKNNELEFEFSLAQNNRMIDLWPNQFLDVSLAAGDTPRGIAYAGNLIPRSITLRLDPDAGCWDTEITCEAETFAELAVIGDVPGIDADLSFPPLPPFPPMPDIPDIEWPPTVTNPNHPTKVVIASNKGVLYTLDFNSDSPIWLYMNSGLSAIDIADIDDMIVTPSGALYLHIYTGNKILRAAGLGGAWTQVASGTTDFHAAGSWIGAMAINPLENDTIGIFALGYYDIGVPINQPGVFKKMVNGVLQTGVEFNGRTGAGVTFTGGEWFVMTDQYGAFSSPWIYVLSSGGSPVFNGLADMGTGSDASPRRFLVPIGNSGGLFAWDLSGAAGHTKITAHGSTQTRYTLMKPTGMRQAIASSPYLTAMGCKATTFTPMATTDAGATWYSVGGVIPTGSDVWESCRDSNRFIFGGGTVIRLTLDLGLSYVDKMGNLGYIAPLIDIVNIRYIE